MTPQRAIILTAIILIVILSIFWPGDTHWFAVLFYVTCGIIIGLWYKDIEIDVNDEIRRWVK